MDRLSHYNQSGSDEDAIQAFVARRDVLDVLTRRLLSVQTDGVVNHQVLIGNRGMGKTSLLRRLAIEIDRDPKLAARFVALRFREEQYNVLSLAAFWRNCIEALAEWAERNELDDLAKKLDDIVAGPQCRDDDSAEHCFFAAMTALEKRAVLLIDNLDLILSALPDVSNWKLRRALQSNAAPVVVGAASQALKSAGDREAAFYEFFQPHYLEPLDLAETRECMLTLASRREPKGRTVKAIIGRQPERLRTLHTLTGGNPRVISLIYRLLESSDTHEVMSDLNALLDDVTPYYKHKIEEYASTQQRAVIDAIALNWDPITTGDLSKLTAIKSTTISPILIRLRRDGMIDNTDVSGSYAGHQIVERFFNIWYLMRHGTRRTKQRMRWLVGFLTSFYSHKELREISRSFQGEELLRQAVHPEYALALRAALAHEERHSNGVDRLAYSKGTSSSEVNASTDKRSENSINDSIPDEFRPAWSAFDSGKPKRIFAELSKLPKTLRELEEIGGKENAGRLFNRQGSALMDIGDFQAAITTFDAVIERYGDDAAENVRERAAIAINWKGNTFFEGGDLAAALAAYDTLIERFRDDEAKTFREKVAWAMVNKGIVLDESGDLASTLKAYDAVIERYGDDEAGNVREVAARAMINIGHALKDSGDLTAALPAFDAVAKRYGDDEADTVRQKAAWAMFNKGTALKDSGDLVAALTAYDAVAERYGDDEAGIVRQYAAGAMVSKGIMLKESGDVAAALPAFDAVIERYGDDKADSVRENVAWTMLHKGSAFKESGDAAAALTTYDAVIELYGDDEVDGVRERAARAMVNKGIVFKESGDLAAALPAFDAVIERYREDEADNVREMAAWAMFNKGIALKESGDLVAALTAYDAVIERYGEDEADNVREMAAWAMFNKGIALKESGDLVAALTAYDAVAEQYGDDEADAVRENASWAMVSKGNALNESADVTAALTAYDAVIERYGDDEADGVRENVAWAMINKGYALKKSGDVAAALTAYDAVIERYGDDELSSLRDKAARALVNKGYELDECGDLASALRAYDVAAERYGEDESDSVRGYAAWAMLNKGYALNDSGDLAAALTAYDVVIERYRDDDADRVREKASWAMVNKGNALNESGDVAAALTAYDAVIERYGDDEADSVREYAVMAMLNKGNALYESGDLSAALTAYDALVQRYRHDQAGSLRKRVAKCRVTWANVLVQSGLSFEIARAQFDQAAREGDALAEPNLVWLHLLNGDDAEAKALWEKGVNVPPYGEALALAAFEFRQDNFGTATKLFEKVIEGELEKGGWTFEDDIERLLIIAKQKGFGERMVAWLIDTNLSERVAPLFVAFNAFVGGEDLLKDTNPETRGLATEIYERLATFERNFSGSLQ